MQRISVFIRNICLEHAKRKIITRMKGHRKSQTDTKFIKMRMVKMENTNHCRTDAEIQTRRKQKTKSKGKEKSKPKRKEKSKQRQIYACFC